MSERTRPVGINHVALEVGDVQEALDFYGRFLELELRELGPHYAYVDLGDQVLAFFVSRGATDEDGRRHVGLVVEDKEVVRRALGLDGCGGRLHFRDPWGNHVQVVDYAECRFRKHPSVASALGLDGLRKVGGSSKSSGRPACSSRTAAARLPSGRPSSVSERHEPL